MLTGDLLRWGRGRDNDVAFSMCCGWQDATHMMFIAMQPRNGGIVWMTAILCGNAINSGAGDALLLSST